MIPTGATAQIKSDVCASGHMIDERMEMHMAILKLFAFHSPFTFLAVVKTKRWNYLHHETQTHWFTCVKNEII